MTIFGDGKQTRAFSYVDDVAPIIARSPLVPAAQNRIFNVGADMPVTILDLAKEVSEALDVPVRLKHLPPRNEVVHAFADHALVKSVFLPGETIDLKTGIWKMAAWVKKRGSTPPIRFDNIEVYDKLPAGWL